MTTPTAPPDAPEKPQKAPGSLRAKLAEREHQERLGEQVARLGRRGRHVVVAVEPPCKVCGGALKADGTKRVSGVVYRYAHCGVCLADHFIVVRNS